MTEIIKEEEILEEKTENEAVEENPVVGVVTDTEEETVINKTISDWYNEKMDEIGTILRPSATLAKIFAFFDIPIIESNGELVSANSILNSVQFSTVSRAGDVELAIFLTQVGDLPILISQVNNLATLTHKVEITRLNTQKSIEEKYIKFYTELKNIINDPIELISYDFGGKVILLEKESYVFNMIREIVLEKVFVANDVTPFVNAHLNNLKTNPINMEMDLQKVFEIINIYKPYIIEVPDFVNYTNNNIKIGVRFDIKELSDSMSLINNARIVTYDLFVLLETEDGNRITRYPLSVTITGKTK